MLFRKTRHDRDAVDAFRVYAEQLGIIALGNGAEHLLRGLCARKLIHKLRIMALDEPHPAGAAGREHRELVLLRMRQLFQELAALLHDREVGGEVRVEDVIEAHDVQRGGKTLDRRFLRLHAERLAPCGADRRRDLHDGDLVRILQGRQHAVGIVALLQGADRAMRDALAAQRALGFLQMIDLGNVHGRHRAGVDHVPHVGRLHMVADLNAAHALDALAVIAHKREAGVRLVLRNLLFKRQLGDIEIVRNRLELAVAAADAGRAVGVMLGEDQLHVRLAGFARLFAVGLDDHALGDRVVAGREQAIEALDLDNADTARADLVQLLPVAQRRDIDAGQTGGFQNRGAFGYLYLHAVNRYVYHFASLPPLKMP